MPAHMQESAPGILVFSILEKQRYAKGNPFILMFLKFNCIEEEQHTYFPGSQSCRYRSLQVGGFDASIFEYVATAVLHRQLLLMYI